MTTADGERNTDSPLDRLMRWEDFGGHWRIDARTAKRLEIALLTCDGGEVTDRIETDEPAVIAYVGDRRSDQEDREP
jgi:hypothetical protein